MSRILRLQKDIKDSQQNKYKQVLETNRQEKKSVVPEKVEKIIEKVERPIEPPPMPPELIQPVERLEAVQPMPAQGNRECVPQNSSPIKFGSQTPWITIAVVVFSILCVIALGLNIFSMREITSYKELITSLYQHNNAQVQRFSLLESEFKTLTTDFRLQKADWQRQLSRVNATLAAQQDFISNMNHFMADTKPQILDMRQKLTANDTKLLELSTSSGLLQSMITDLKNKNEQVIKQGESLTDRLNELSSVGQPALEPITVSQ